VTVEHGLVDARVVAFGAFERLQALVVSKVVLEMVFELRDKAAELTLELLLHLYVNLVVTPVLLLQYQSTMSGGNN